MSALFYYCQFCAERLLIEFNLYSPDINECDLELLCDTVENKKCKNTKGNYTCVCMTNFVAVDGICIDALTIFLVVNFTDIKGAVVSLIPNILDSDISRKDLADNVYDLLKSTSLSNSVLQASVDSYRQVYPFVEVTLRIDLPVSTNATMNDIAEAFFGGLTGADNTQLPPDNVVDTSSWASMMPDIDPCEEGTHNCFQRNFTSCVFVSSEIFTCEECRQGFQQVDDSCHDINECESELCGENTYCMNTDGSFLCECNAGYIQGDSGCIEPTTAGDQTTVEAVESSMSTSTTVEQMKTDEITTAYGNIRVTTFGVSIPITEVGGTAAVFVGDLNDPTSAIYNNYEQNICDSVTFIYDVSTDISDNTQGCSVSSFESGSIIANVEVEFREGVTNANQLQTVLMAAVENNTLTGTNFTVNSTSIIVIEMQSTTVQPRTVATVESGTRTVDKVSGTSVTRDRTALVTVRSTTVITEELSMIETVNPSRPTETVVKPTTILTVVPSTEVLIEQTTALAMEQTTIKVDTTVVDLEHSTVAVAEPSTTATLKHTTVEAVELTTVELEPTTKGRDERTTEAAVEQTTSVAVKTTVELEAATAAVIKTTTMKALESTTMVKVEPTTEAALTPTTASEVETTTEGRVVPTTSAAVEPTTVSVPTTAATLKLTTTAVETATFVVSLRITNDGTAEAVFGDDLNDQTSARYMQYEQRICDSVTTIYDESSDISSAIRGCFVSRFDEGSIIANLQVKFTEGATDASELQMVLINAVGSGILPGTAFTIDTASITVIEMTLCASGFCENGGTCDDSVQPPVCTCLPEYSGDKCQDKNNTIYYIVIGSSVLFVALLLVCVSVLTWLCIYRRRIERRRSLVYKDPRQKMPYRFGHLDAQSVSSTSQSDEILAQYQHGLLRTSPTGVGAYIQAMPDTEFYLPYVATGEEGLHVYDNRGRSNFDEERWLDRRKDYQY
ncbi:galactose-specific cell agglutination protein gsf2-like [Anneissia japonica]|uniref:galactose-specific cell agglutination protein gsf2-like n=1 Tax=Anneissia japonica TaxID=1529436 RepID=UPI0014258AAE|nr:galactose-specific cell agglutination protein gsf2-like [Anneissia japonica]